MMKSRSANRPPISMIDTEANALSDLALSAERRLPQVSMLLLNEISRATILDAGRIPDDIVTMLAMVQFRDAASGTTRQVRLVYPRDADISQGCISILTPIGAGLIGLRTGQSILWPDRDGNQRLLTIISVLRPDREHKCLKIEESARPRVPTAMLKQNSDESGVDVIVQITLDRRCVDQPNRFEAAVLECEEIQECLLLSRDMSYWLRLRIDSIAAFETIRKDFLARLPGVCDLSASFVVKDLFRRSRRES